MKYTKRLRKYIFKYKGRLFLGFLLGTLFSACDIIIPFLIGYIIDIFNEILYCSSFVCSDSLIDSIIKILLIILSLVILLILFNYFFGIIISLTGERICKDIKNDLFQKINSMSIKDVDSKQKGDLVSRIINDVDYVNTDFIPFKTGESFYVCYLRTDYNTINQVTPQVSNGSRMLMYDSNKNYLYTKTGTFPAPYVIDIENVALILPSVLGYC